MDSSAYEAMHALQDTHWWWQGMSRIYQTALAAYLPPSREQRKVLDIGCGFGNNFPVLNPSGDVVGLDFSLDTLRAVRTRPVLGLVQARADALPFKSGTFDVITLLAVIEHAECDATVLTEAHRVSHSGALQLLSTSAFMVLWSRHDLANEHRRRYQLAQLQQLQTKTHWRVKLITYVNAFVFPGALVIRLLQRQIDSRPVYDMGPNLPLFGMLLRLESWWIFKMKRHLPWGINLIVVATRDE